MHLSDWMERVDLGVEIQEVYLHSFLFKLAINLVSIFLPLYILNMGYGTSVIFIFFAIYYGVYLFASFPGAWVATKLGYKHTSLTASPFILIFYMLLRSNPSEPLLYMTAVLGGLSFNLYWMGMNPEIAESSHDGDREKETGYFFSMPTLAAMLAPTVGGLILSLYSFDLLFLAATGLIAMSFTPFLFSDEHKDGMDMDPKAFFSMDYFNDFMTYTFKGAQSMVKKVLWPLYLALVIQGSVNIGGAGSLLALGSAIASISLGKFTDDSNRNEVILSGVAVTSLTFIAMSFVTTPLVSFIVSFFNGLGRTAISLPVYSRAMDRAEEEDYVEYFAFREIGLSTGRTASLISFMLIFMYLPNQFLLGFTYAAISLLFVGY
ncbi:MAG: MFS transporter, partial [Candidatus Nanohalobium sp.]